MHTGVPWDFGLPFGVPWAQKVWKPLSLCIVYTMYMCVLCIFYAYMFYASYIIDKQQNGNKFSHFWLQQSQQTLPRSSWDCIINQLISTVTSCVDVSRSLKKWCKSIKKMNYFIAQFAVINVATPTWVTTQLTIFYYFLKHSLWVVGTWILSSSQYVSTTSLS